VTTIDGEAIHRCIVGQDLGPTTVVHGFSLAYGAGFTASTLWGGGMLLFRSAAVVEDNRFEYCSSRGGGAVMARDRHVTGQAGIFRRNVFVNNLALDLGGAIELSANAHAVIESNTFASNRANDRGGAILVNNTGTTATLSRNIFWNNTVGTNGAAVACIGFSGPTVSGDCNVFWMNTGGGNVPVLGCPIYFGSDGNALADPQFCDGVGGQFGLRDSSPGAPAHSGGCGLIGALDVGCPGLDAPLSGAEHGGGLDLSLAPVPSAGAVTLAVTAPAAPFTVEVFDMWPASFST
jgi:predicted outer membrane repeat protein